MQLPSDEALLAAYKDPARQNEAFGQIVKKYERALYRHIRRMVIDHDDADDLLQTVFIKAWKNLDGFRGDSKLSSWLYRIATNETISFLRKKKRFIFLPILDVEKELENKLDSQTHFDADEAQLKLQKAILTLPEKQRVVFNLKYFDEMKYEDMSEILQTSVGALKASYHHAVKKIEKYLIER